MESMERASDTIEVRLRSMCLICSAFNDRSCATTRKVSEFFFDNPNELTKNIVRKIKLIHMVLIDQTLPKESPSLNDEAAQPGCGEKQPA